jgi:urea transport system permease protein
LGLAIVRSKVGLVLRAIREDAARVRYFGYDVAAYETLIFCVSAAIAGWAGMLYVLVLEFASPTYMSVPFSLAIVIWCAVGGRDSVIAAAIGGIVVNMLEGRLSDVFVEGWFLMLGVLFIFVVLVMPRGLHGLCEAAVAWLRRAISKRRIRSGQAGSVGARSVSATGGH